MSLLSHRQHAWLVTLSAALFFTYDFIQLNIFNSIGYDVSQEFHLSSTELGTLSGIYLTAQTLTLFSSGYLLDRLATRKIILTGMGLCVLATFGSSLAPSVLWLMVARALAGMTGAFCFLSALLLASTWFVPGRMSTAVGAVVTMGMLGGVLAQSPMDYWVSQGGWRYAMLLNAITGVVLWLWMAWIVRSGPHQLNRPHHPPFWSSLWRVLQEKQNWLAGIYTALMNMVLFVLGALWGSRYLMVAHHVDSASAAWIVTQLFFGTIVGAPLWGYWVDRSKERRASMVSGALLSLLLLIMIRYAQSLAVWQWSALFFLLGVTTSTQVLSYPHIAACNPREHLGLAESFAALFILGLGAIGQPFMGWLMDLHRLARQESGLHYIASDFDTAMYLFPLLLVLALLCALNIRLPKHPA